MSADILPYAEMPYLKNFDRLECPCDLVSGQGYRIAAMALPMIEKMDVTLDLSRVKAVDAAGLALLVFLRQCAERAGTRLQILYAPRLVAEMLAPMAPNLLSGFLPDYH